MQFQPRVALAAVLVVSLASVVSAGILEAGRPDPAFGNFLLWLDAAQGLTLSGSEVTGWADQATAVGGANDALKVGSAGPTLVAGAYAGQPALRFNGTSSYLQIGANSAFDSDQFTWFIVGRSSLMPAGAQNVFRSAYGSGATTAASNDRMWGSFTQDGRWQVNARTSAGGYVGSYVTGSPNLAWVSAQWAANDSLTTWMDGATATAAGATAAPSGHLRTTIGKSSVTSEGLYYAGDISEILVYNTTLSAADRQQVEAYLEAKYFPPQPRQTLAFWTFDEYAPGAALTDGKRLADSSGRGRDAFAGGGANPPALVAGAGGVGGTTALRLDADRDAAIYRDAFAFSDGGPAADGDINFRSADSFTLEACFRTSAATGIQSLVVKDVGSNVPSWWLRINAGRLQFLVGDGPNERNLYPANNVADGLWHHVAAIRDQTDNLLKLYLDYALIGTIDDPTVGGLGNANDIRIGENNSGANQFIGDIDYVRISLGALQASDLVNSHVPEPASLTLLLAASAGIGGYLRRRRTL